MRLIAAVLAFGLLLPAPAAASVAEGLARWRAGDAAAAVELWQGPAARNDPDALFHLGQAHALGRGVPPDMDQAIELWRRAAARGHVPATASLGIALWQRGRRAEALGHLRTAADRGDVRAAYVLGVAHFSGDGVPRNPALGYAYVVRAREGGLAPAAAEANRMAGRLAPEERARGEAAAQALASGRPVAVVMAELAQPAEPATTDVAAIELADARSEEEAESEGPAPRPTPAARPVARPSSPPASAQPAGEGWRVQLGAYATEQAARTAWATVVAQSAALLKGQTPLYAPRAGLVRLQVGPFADRAQASDLCAKLSAAGRPCFVTR
ncbi:MAG: SPOR domain-containing protein [Sphingomonadaceae bacterium]